MFPKKNLKNLSFCAVNTVWRRKKAWTLAHHFTPFVFFSFSACDGVINVKTPILIHFMSLRCSKHVVCPINLTWYKRWHAEGHSEPPKTLLITT